MKKAKYVLELENHTFLALSNDIRQKRISGSHHAKDDITITDITMPKDCLNVIQS